MEHVRRVWIPLALTGLLLGGSARATTLFDPDPTGVSTGVFLEVRGVETTDEDAGASFISSSAAADSEASGMASATFPNPNGTGGSVSAKSSVSSAVGAGVVSSMSTSLFLGEFTADDGDSSTLSFDLIVDLGIDGFLSVNDNNSGTGFNSSVSLVFSAVKENLADPDNPIILGSFAGVASLSRTDFGFPFGLFPPTGSSLAIFGFDPSRFSSSAGCTGTDIDSIHNCTVTANTTESIAFNVNDGELFGLLLFLSTQTTIDNGFDLELHSNFNNTVSLEFPQTANGVTVTSLPPTFQQDPGAVPEPTTLALLSLGLAGLGFARRRLH